MTSSSKRRSNTVRLTLGIRSKIYDIGKLLNSSSCLEIVQGFVEGKRLSELLEQCLNDIKSFLEKVVNITNTRITGFGKCFQKCSEIAKEYYKMFKSLDSMYNFVLKDFTSMGDSSFRQEDIPSEVKRIARHVDVSREIFSIHFMRIGLAKSFIKDMMKCVTENCKEIEMEKREIVNEMRNYIEKTSDLSIKNFLLTELEKWCKEYNVC